MKTKNIFISGGTTGIGEALVRKYLEEENVRVAICARSEDKFLKAFSTKEREKIKFYTIDVTQRKAVKDALEDFVPATSGEFLDVMIANAGISNDKGRPYQNFDLWYEIININTLGVLHCFEAALNKFDQKKGGHLVAIASVAGLIGLPNVAPYSASKAAVIKLCESMSIDLKKKNITVTAILPGFIDTPLTRKNKHAMPFIMSADKAANKIYRAIRLKKAYFIFPWQMNFLVNFLQYLPRSWYRFLMATFDYSSGKNH